MKPTKASAEIAARIRSHGAANQSTSCPLSSTICSVPSQSAMSAKPA